MLTELMIRQAQAKEKQYSLPDGRGLMLLVHPNGRKYWVLRVYVDGKERRRSLGTWPELPLKEARLRAYEVRERTVDETTALATPGEATFENVARQWLEARMGDKAPGYVRTVRLRLEKFILPKIGYKKLGHITSAAALDLCRDIEARGTLETAARVKQIIGAVFRFAIASGLAESDPTAALTGALKTRKEKHMPTITDPARIAVLMGQMRAYPYDVLRAALLFSIYTFARPGEVRTAEWKEIDLDAALWKLPAEKMKMKRAHIVPLARQVVELLTELKPLTGRGRWVFPSARRDGRCMSENAVRVALRSMGYSNDDIVPHGFRSMASTLLNEQGWEADVIERQLAHVERNQVRAAYNRAEYLDERRRMMQSWADWLDGLPQKVV